MTETPKNSRKAKAGTAEYAEVKGAMVAAAIELMAEKGYRKFRFEELAERVGYNRATIYRYFDSKKDLMAEVMLTLMHEITVNIIQGAVGTTRVTRKSFTDSLYHIITELRSNPRYALVVDAQNVETFSRLTHDHFSSITTSMLEQYMVAGAGGKVLKEGIDLSDTVHWLMHQIISYGFFGLKGSNEKQQKAYLEKMVVSVII